MAIISSTVLATSQPRGLDRGFTFFPPNTSLQNPADVTGIGIDASDTEFGEPFLNISIPLILWRVRTQASAKFIAAAFVGYNLQYTVAGALASGAASLGAGSASLSVSNDAAAGGIGFGLGFDLKFTFSLDEGNIGFDWRSGFRTTWQEVFSFTLEDAFIDLISLAASLLEKAGFSLGPLAKIRDVAGKGAIWGLYDSASSQMASLGYLELKPKIALHGNLLDAAAAVSTKVKAFLKVLKTIGIKPAVGPVLNFYFPVRIQIVRLTTQYGNFDASATFPSSTRLGIDFVKVDGPNVPVNPPPVTNFSMTHTHSIDFKIGLSIKLKIKLWSVFTQEVNIPIDLTGLVPAFRGSSFGAPPLAGPYFNRLATGGSTAADLPEVIWG